MADWPFIQGDMRFQCGIGQKDTPGGAANTKSAWAEIIAATNFEAAGFYMWYWTSLPADGLFDVGIGAAGSEQVILSNIPVSAATALNSRHGIIVPLSIPAGSRIALRNQFNSVGPYSWLFICLYPSPFWGLPQCHVADTYGANEADSGGTSIDPGATANTKGSWVEITSSTNRLHRVLYLAVTHGQNTTRTTCQWLVDIGVGASGSEQVIVPNIPLRCHQNLDLPVPLSSGPFLVNIPAGSRLAVRAQCSITDASDRLFDAVLLALS